MRIVSFLLGVVQLTCRLGAEDVVKVIGGMLQLKGGEHQYRELLSRLPNHPENIESSFDSRLKLHLRGGSTFSPWMTCSNIEERRKGDGTHETDHEMDYMQNQNEETEEPTPGFWSTDIHAVEQVYGKAYCYSAFRTTPCYVGPMSKEGLEQGRTNIDPAMFRDDNLDSNPANHPAVTWCGG